MAKPLPYIKNETLHTPDGNLILRLPMPGRERTGWLDWLQDPRHTSFRFESRGGVKITVRKEHRTGATGNDHFYWIAYRKINNKLKRKSLGKSQSVTLKTLESAAKKLASVELPHMGS